MITEEEVLKLQNEWGQGIVSIGNTFKNAGDYKKEASDFINRLYSYDIDGGVLFKPTLAADIQFRLTKDAALSYFVGGNTSFLEDKGFAIKGWSFVRWENVGIKIINNIAVCMGNYFFGMINEPDLKVEFTIVIKKKSDNLKIILHDSHLPFDNK